MSRVIEHGCRIASPAWAVNTENLFYWNTRTGNNPSTDLSLLRQNVKIKCKEYFSYPMLAYRSVNRPKHVVRWYTRSFPWLRIHLPHMPAHSRQSERQNIIARTHTWQQCSVNTSEAILTTKYGFNLRYISPLGINNELDNSTNILAEDKRAAHAPIGLHSHQVGTLLKRTWVSNETYRWPIRKLLWKCFQSRYNK